MAEIYPFKAFRYHRNQVQFEDVLTQPYDKISPEMQEDYYRRSPFNLVRVELGKPEPGDSPGNDRYTRAADCIRDWKVKGVLTQDAEPCLYAYEQRFEVPGRAGEWHARRGFIGLLRLADYDERIVYRHEQTLSKPKSDRLKLLQATHLLTGQIFMLYRDQERRIDSLVWESAQGIDPSTSITDEFGVQHSLWKISDGKTIRAVQELMALKKLIIADGHHRYETSLTYRNLRREQASPVAQTDRPASFELLMSTFVNTESEGLVVLPTHRVVSGLEAFDPGQMLARSDEFFDVTKIPDTFDTSEVLDRIGKQEDEHNTTMAACLHDGCYLLRAKPEKIDAALATVPAEQRKLDVVQLHEVLLGKVLGITHEQVREQSYLRYFRSAEEAGQQLKQGADVVFLINPVTMEQLQQVAFAGQVMPQKSTDFYPKLLSGITMYDLE